MATAFENLIFSQLAYQDLESIKDLENLNEVDKGELYKKLSDHVTIINSGNAKVLNILNSWKVIDEGEL